MNTLTSALVVEALVCSWAGELRRFDVVGRHTSGISRTVVIQEAFKNLAVGVMVK